MVSLLTSSKAGLIYGPAGVAALLLLGKRRAAMTFAAVGGVVAVVAVLGDYTLGEIIGRTRPLAGSTVPSFPSGHVFGSTVFFGFSAYLAVYYRLRKSLLIPLLVLLAAIIVAVGPARVYEQAHWPTDVAAGYLLGALWLVALIPAFGYLRRTTAGPASNSQAVMPRSGSAPIMDAPRPPGYRVERSIASVVQLDPERGTATKMYRAPAVIRMLYWLAFQAPFPYEHNAVALQVAAHRRRIASLLTIHRFGKDLVAPVVAVISGGDRYSLVTEYVPGDKVENDAPAKGFLREVADTFADAGLSVWQLNPRNPHAHTNLIRTPEGDLKVIDLESAVVTPMPAPGQWRAALKSGNLPVFDDIDIPRLRRFADASRETLLTTLGPEMLVELEDTVERCDADIRLWKEAEPRVWGRLARRVYGLLDWSGSFRRVARAMDGGDRLAVAFLSAGIERWERDERVSPSDAASLRAQLASNELRDALHHLGAHLVISILLRFPFSSVGRFAWTVSFWALSESRRLRRRSGGTVANIHNPLVMGLSLVPGLGAIAYLAARPLRKRLLVRLMLDQTAWKLPFRLYCRLHLARWLAPRATGMAGPTGHGNKTLPGYVFTGGKAQIALAANDRKSSC